MDALQMRLFLFFLIFCHYSDVKYHFCVLPFHLSSPSLPVERRWRLQWAAAAAMWWIGGARVRGHPSYSGKARVRGMAASRAGTRRMDLTAIVVFESSPPPGILALLHSNTQLDPPSTAEMSSPWPRCHHQMCSISRPATGGGFA